MIAALALGLAVGTVLATTSRPAAGFLTALIEPLGLLFVNAIRMTVIPLVVAKLVVAVASAADDRALKRVGTGALVLFVGTVGLAASFGAVSARLALPYLHAGTAAASMGAANPGGAAGVAAGTRELPDFAQFLVGLVPPNPFKAASDGGLLPLVVFALALGFALSRVQAPSREAVVRFFQGMADAMIVLIGWVMRAAPVGVFALAVPLAVRMGLGALGAVAFYIALVAAVTVAFALVLLYPAAVLGGGVPLARFARACAPVQALAFSSRSSLACLPVMVEQARDTLKLPDAVTALFLPVAAAMFRAGSAIGTTIGALFLAHLYGVPLTAMETAVVAVTAVLTMFGSPGVPSGAVVIIVPILASAGVPVEGIGILLAVDTLPDMFRTTTNVTATMAGAAVLGRFVGLEPSAALREPAAGGSVPESVTRR
jgi:Na+/H+-dicarboxylate symporter